jgi:8-oxo-dGTP diphosphatase
LGTEAPGGRVSGRVLLERAERLALIRRIRDRREYYLFPGGGVEAGETPADAAVREACEELGLHVAVVRQKARVFFGFGVQHYFTVRELGGRFGAGRGPEFTGAYPPERGHYEPVWLSLPEAAAVEVRPAPLMARLLVEGFGFLYRVGVIELSDPPS